MANMNVSIVIVLLMAFNLSACAKLDRNRSRAAVAAAAAAVATASEVAAPPTPSSMSTTLIEFVNSTTGMCHTHTHTHERKHTRARVCFILCNHDLINIILFEMVVFVLFFYHCSTICRRMFALILMIIDCNIFVFLSLNSFLPHFCFRLSFFFSILLVDLRRIRISVFANPTKKKTQNTNANNNNGAKNFF